MVIHMQTGAIILAAGLSSRMGEFKPLMEIGGQSMLQQVVSRLLLSQENMLIK